MKSIFIIALVLVMTCEYFSCHLIPISNVNTSKTYHLKTDTKMDWFRANHYCLSHGMRLATILSKEESDEVTRLIDESGYRQSFWIGGTCWGNKPDFYWMGNEKEMIFTNWGKDEPNRYEGIENCIEIWTLNNFTWNDKECTALNAIICEDEEQQQPTPLNSVSPISNGEN